MNGELTISPMEESVYPAATNVEYRVVDPVLDPHWDSMVQEHPRCTIFHTSNWARVLCKTYSHRPVYLTFSDGKRIKAIVPLMEVSSPITGRRGVGLPFADFC